MKKTMSFLAGTIMGGLVGATLAILFTPAAGDELREQITDIVKNFQDEIKSAAESRREELESQLNALRSPKGPEIS